MKNLVILILFISNFLCIGQDLTELNENLDLTDSLTKRNEIRIYKGFGLGNYTGIFRMYQAKNQKWTAEYFDHYSEVPNFSELRVEKNILNPKSDMQLIWLNIIKTRIPDLPNMSEIEWKFQGEPEIVEFNGEQELMWKKTEIIDGESYVVQFRWGNDSKKITYWNPESYLEVYPDMDELIYFIELLNLVRTEFGVWKNN